MARFCGKDGAVYVDDVKLAATTAWSYQEAANKIDVSAMGDSSAQYIGGMVEGSGTFDCRFDSADDSMKDTMALVRQGGSCELILYGDDLNGSVAWTGDTITIESYSVSTAMDGAIDVTFGFAGGMILSGT